MKKTIASGLLAVCAAASLSIIGPAPAASAAEGCPSITKLAAVAKPLRATTSYDRLVQLMYDPASRCAFGRVTNGKTGDKIWLARSSNKVTQVDLSTYDGYSFIPYGSTSTRTPQGFSDKGVYMRTCFTPSGMSKVQCTDWG